MLVGLHYVGWVNFKLKYYGGLHGYHKILELLSSINRNMNIHIVANMHMAGDGMYKDIK